MPENTLPVDLGRVAYEAESKWLGEIMPGVHTPSWDDIDPEYRSVYQRVAGAVAAFERGRADRGGPVAAEVREVIATFMAHHGHSSAVPFQRARDLAEGIRQVLDREPMKERDDEKGPVVAEAIPEAWIDAALAADAEWMRVSRSVVFTSPARDQVRMMLEAAAPLIAAAERERIRQMAIRTRAACYGVGGHSFADLIGGPGRG